MQVGSADYQSGRDALISIWERRCAERQIEEEKYLSPTREARMRSPGETSEKNAPNTRQKQGALMAREEKGYRNYWKSRQGRAECQLEVELITREAMDGLMRVRMR